MLHTLDVVAANGTPFRVLAIPAGEAGPNVYRTPAGRTYPMVEFYDRHLTSAHVPGLGQFTGGCYRLGTLRNRPHQHGLNLAGGVPSWSVDGWTMGLVMEWLNRLDERGELA